jgi:hypothetical protein
MALLVDAQDVCRGVGAADDDLAQAIKQSGMVSLLERFEIARTRASDRSVRARACRKRWCDQPSLQSPLRLPVVSTSGGETSCARLNGRTAASIDFVTTCAGDLADDAMDYRLVRW